MKYPEVAGFDALLPRLGEFDAIIDVRSEAEFALDHIPGAINCPVLDNDERIRVGTMYVQVNSFEAKKVGAALVSRNIARHIETLWIDKPRDWKPLIYCWRGGNRSGAMAHVLARIGWPAIQLDGGYKAYRAHVSEALADCLPRVRTHLDLHGPLGVGLRLSAAAAETLDRPDTLARFKDFLSRGSFYVFTLNGFPFGAFHGTRRRGCGSRSARGGTGRCGGCARRSGSRWSSAARMRTSRSAAGTLRTCETTSPPRTNTDVSPSVRTDSTRGCTTQGPIPSWDSSSPSGPPGSPSNTTTPRPPAPTRGFTTAGKNPATAGASSLSSSTDTVGTTGRDVAARSTR